MQVSVRQALLELKRAIEYHYPRQEKALAGRKHYRFAVNKRLLYIKQRGRCACCNNLMSYSFKAEGGKAPKNSCTTEHLIPRSAAIRNFVGSHENLFNKVLTCRRCNELRGITPWEEFCVLIALDAPVAMIKKNTNLWQNRWQRYVTGHQDVLTDYVKSCFEAGKQHAKVHQRMAA